VTIGPGDEAARDAATDSVTFAFADAEAQLYGLARLGLAREPSEGTALALLFAGREPVAAHARGGLPVTADASWEELELGGLRTRMEQPLTHWSAEFAAGGGDGFALEFLATGDPAGPVDGDPVTRLGGLAGYGQPCRVRGTVRVRARERRVDCLGERSHAWGEPDWKRIELARSVAAWTGSGANAALTAVRPAGARHHADEALWAALWEPEGLLPLDEARLSTTYDAHGRTRRAGFELWPAEDGEGNGWARRGAGEVLCGSSLDLGALRLDCAFFRWHLEGREGVGRYDMIRPA
jgi:hypothetical protein